jgi:dihydroorotase
MTRISIRGGRVVCPATGQDGIADVHVADGRIVALGKAPRGFRADTEFDAAGKLVLPGLVDLCARLREPGAEHKATIASEAAAAVAGGITTLCCPPDTRPVVDTPAVAELMHQRAAAAAGADVCVLGAMTRGLEGEVLAEMQALKAAGCCGVSDAGRAITSSEVLRRAMEYAAGCGITVFISPLDPVLGNAGVMHEGAVSTRLGLPPVPASAEVVAVARALVLAEEAGARLHLGRISAAGSVWHIRAARERGVAVTADTGICHLHLIDTDVGGYDANCHLVPPLRAAADRDALVEGVASGVIDAVCSDHQPHDADAKAAPFSLTEPGASTLDVFLPLLLELVRDRRLEMARAVAAVTAAPARILGLAPVRIAAEAVANITVVDPDAGFEVSAAALHSAGRNNPFVGRRLHGRVLATMLRGAWVFGP